MLQVENICEFHGKMALHASVVLCAREHVFLLRVLEKRVWSFWWWDVEYWFLMGGWCALRWLEWCKFRSGLVVFSDFNDVFGGNVVVIILDTC